MKHPGELGQFDIVILAHVLSSFDAETRIAVVGRVADAMTSEGVLMLGAGETLPRADRQRRRGAEDHVGAAGCVGSPHASGFASRDFLQFGLAEARGRQRRRQGLAGRAGFGAEALVQLAFALPELGAQIVFGEAAEAFAQFGADRFGVFVVVGRRRGFGELLRSDRQAFGDAAPAFGGEEIAVPDGAVGALQCVFACEARMSGHAVSLVAQRRGAGGFNK
jgi:hypothetical protein